MYLLAYSLPPKCMSSILLLQVDPAQAYQLLLISKDLWRRGYVKCPSECDAATETDTATGGKA